MPVQLKNGDAYGRNTNFLFLTIISIVSFYTIFKNGYSAYEWPVADMFPFFEVNTHPEHLKNDFFANSSREPNPRWIFGYFILGISKLFYANWYSVVFFFKALFTALLPCLYYLVVYNFVNRITEYKFPNRIQIIVLLGVILILQPRFTGLFSIAWWAPINTQTIPQTMSLFTGLTAMILFEKRSVNKIFLPVFFLAATLFQPAIGLFLICFHAILNFDFLKRDQLYFTAVFVIGFILPAIIFKVFFTSDIQVGTAAFIDIYIKLRHSAHYQFSKFGSYTNYSWTVSLYLMLILLFIPFGYFYFKKKFKFCWLSASFILSLLTAVFSQWIFIDLIPIKFVATLGPVRFTQLSFWMILIIWTIMLAEIPYIPQINLNFKASRLVFSVVMVGLLVFAVFKKDNPKTDIPKKNIPFSTFIRSTNVNSIFITYPGSLPIDLTNVYDRAVFIENGFPFNEKYFKEYLDRFTLAYGTKKDLDQIKGNSDGEKRAAFYRQLTPDNFLTIADHYPINFVIVETPFADGFRNFKPAFTDKDMSVYKINDFKRAKVIPAGSSTK